MAINAVCSVRTINSIGGLIECGRWKDVLIYGMKLISTSQGSLLDSEKSIFTDQHTATRLQGWADVLQNLNTVFESPVMYDLA